MKKITHYYRNGIYLYSKTVETQDKEIKPIGEILVKPRFEDLVYNSRQKEFMGLILERIKKERINLLFSGLAGTGKTLSAKMLACESKKPFLYINGQMSQKKIADSLLNAKKGAIICIDEIHNLSERVGETIYPAIEYNEISLKGEIKKLNDPLFIGTTTEAGSLPKPLLNRFFIVDFDEPTKEQVTEILKKKLSIEVIEYLTNYTLNLRVLNKLVDMINLFKGDYFKVFRVMGINPYSGLSFKQEKLINYLKTVKKASLRNLSLVLRISENEIKLDIEPELIRKNIIIISSRGRELNRGI